MGILRRKPYLNRLKAERLLREPRMTFVIGFKCADGVLLCADSYESDGLTKRTVDKIRAIGCTSDWGVAIGGAGSSGLIDKFSDEMAESLGRGRYDKRHIEQTTEKILHRFKTQYQEDDDTFRVLVATYCISRNERHLYRSDGTHISPIKDHVHIGMGHSLWRFFVEILYQKGTSVADNTRLALFVSRQAANYVDGVDEPIRIISYTFGDNQWQISNKWRIGTIDFDCVACDPYSVLHEAWRKAVPPTLPEQIAKFKTVKNPGDELTFLRGVKVEEVLSASDWNRASTVFWNNRDKLRIRASLVESRRLAAESNNPQS